MERALVAGAVACACATACGSSAPPKQPEPEPAPLVIPPLPPQKEPEPSPRFPEGRETTPPRSEERPMAVPGPLALPCSSDAECMTHRCNTQYAKCAFPCKSDRDCIAGSTCFVQGGPTMATCIPQAQAVP